MIKRMPRGGVPRLAAASDAILARTIASAPAGAAQADEAELYRRFAPRVRLFGLVRLRDAAAADDLVQQVFLVTLERLRGGEIRNVEAIGSFILGTSRTIAADLRRRRERRERLTEMFADRTAAISPREGTLDTARLEHCLGALPPRDRMLLVLTFYAEKTAADIAAELQLAPGAVRVARHRALTRLRDCVVGGPDKVRPAPGEPR
jgi:RNA polymerase sigma-70 factor (ECF subfamily)